MSKYVELMGERKKALYAGDEERAEKLMKAIDALVRRGEVTDDEFVAGAYL